MRYLTGIFVCLVFAGIAYADDPGIPDTIIVGTVYAEPGQEYVDVPIYTVTDDSVIFYFMPIAWSSGLEGIEPSEVFYYYPLTYWHEVNDTILVDEHYVSMIGWENGQHYLNTGGNRWHCWDIRFTITNMAPPQIIAIDSGYDPVNGTVLYGLVGGVDAFMPQFISGAIYYGIPAGIDDDEPVPPLDFVYLQNYPNPFNASTTIEFTLPKAADIELAVYNLLGQKIAVLFDGRKPAGEHSVAWNAGNLPSGIYFAKMEAANYSKNTKMILLK